MDLKDFLHRLADVLDHDGDISPDQAVSSIDEWDSLGVLSVIVLLSELGVRCDPELVREVVSISDLLDIVSGVVNVSG